MSIKSDIAAIKDALTALSGDQHAISMEPEELTRRVQHCLVGCISGHRDPTDADTDFLNAFCGDGETPDSLLDHFRQCYQNQVDARRKLAL